MTDAGDGPLPPAFDDLAVGVLLHDPDSGAILDANESAAELYGYPTARLRSMDVADLTARSAEFTQAEAAERISAAADGESQRFEWQVRRANGEVRWVRVHLNDTSIDGGAVLAEVSDITEQRNRERRLRLFSRIIRHNLRNTATGLVGYAETIERAIETESVEEEVDTLVSLARDVGELSSSVDQVEEIVALDSTDRTPVDLSDVVPPLVDEIRSEHETVSVTAAADTEIWVMGSKGLEYALKHALGNAVEHNPDADATLTVTTEANEETAVVEIADNGPLIPDAEIEVLEETVEASSTYHGTGVGLWVVDWAIDSLGGELSFEENGDGGNTVRIQLPRIERE